MFKRKKYLQFKHYGHPKKVGLGLPNCNCFKCQPIE